MDTLKIIQSPVEADLLCYKQLFHESLRTDTPLLRQALNHLVQKQGKLMRPTIVFLSAKAFGGEVGDAVLNSAVAFEMLHTASLVHDDVVDESDRRRGQASINALMDNKVAVLVGDYLLSKAVQHSADTGSAKMVNVIAGLGMTLADGELLQLSNTESPVIDEDSYYRVVRKKTAALFSMSAWSGSFLSGATEEQAKQMREFGDAIGICFQIRDDIFDYDSLHDVGKPAGNDMKEGKLTLPVIYAVTRPGAEHEMELAFKVRAQQASQEEIDHLVNFTKTSGGIDYALEAMEQYADRARQLLAQCTNAQVADALDHYVDYVMDRKL